MYPFLTSQRIILTTPLATKLDMFMTGSVMTLPIHQNVIMMGVPAVEKMWTLHTAWSVNVKNLLIE